MSIARVGADQLHKELMIGVLDAQGEVCKGYSLLRSNGIAEKVFTDKAGAKPYTWMSNVITIAIDQLGGEKIGAPARHEYIRTAGISPPAVVLRLPINDANTVLIETHRTVWKNLLTDQDVICKYCGHKMTMDIDLNRIAIESKHRWKLEREWQEIVVDLPSGYTYEGFNLVGQHDRVAHPDYVGTNFNRMVFRIPTLGDGIRHEKICTDPIPFWRKIASDCLLRIESVSPGEDGHFLAEMPKELRAVLGMKLFDELLYTDDLDAIRVALREDPPTMPYYYLEECANASCRRETDIVIEASAFFSV